MAVVAAARAAVPAVAVNLFSITHKYPRAVFCRGYFFAL